MSGDEEPAPWTRIEELFHAARHLSRNRRGAFVDRIRQDEPALAGELARLLEGADDEAFLACGPLGDHRLPDMEEALDLTAGGRSPLIGCYRLESLLAAGEACDVYLARRVDDATRTPYAVKLLQRRMATPALWNRLRRESETLAGLDHPGIARFVASGEDDTGRAYLVTAFAGGPPLLESADVRALGLRARLELFVEVCDAVAHLHVRGLLHLDLKPQHVLVSESGPCIIDFGTVCTAAEVAGASVAWESTPLTVGYASPEQIQGDPVSAASDVFALGVMLHELLSGIHPLRGEGASALDWARATCESDSTLPSVAVRRAPTSSVRDRGARTIRELVRSLEGPLDAVILRALARDPVQRYPNAGAMVQDLRRFLDGRPVSARRRSRWRRSLSGLRRHRIRVLGGVAILVIAAPLVEMAWRHARDQDVARSAPEHSERVLEVLRGALQHPSEGPNARGPGLDRIVATLEADVNTELAEPSPAGIEAREILARLHVDAARYAAAEEPLVTALAMSRALDPADHATEVRLRHLMGHVLARRGFFREAAAHFERVLGHYRAAPLPGDALHTALLSLAGTQTALEDWDAAGISLAELLALPSPTGAGGRVAVAEGRALHALALMRDRKTEEARGLLDEALARVEADDSLPRARIANAMARWLAENGERDRARKLLERTLAAPRAEDDALDLVLARSNLGLLELRDRDHVAAAASLERAAREVIDIDPRCPEAPRVLMNLSVARRLTGDLDGATESLLRGAAILDALPGPPPTARAEFAVRLGDARFDQERHADARRWYERADVEFGRLEWSEPSPLHVHAVARAAHLATSQCGGDGAAALLDRGVELLGRCDPGRERWLIHARTLVGDALHRAGRAEDAAEVLRVAYRAACARFGAEHRETRELAARLR